MAEAAAPEKIDPQCFGARLVVMSVGYLSDLFEMIWNSRHRVPGTRRTD
jgi:hypothetical protein